jgi:TonB family protein
MTAPMESIRAPMVLEFDRAILVLKRGLKEHWATRDQYLASFEKTSSTDLTGRSVTKAKEYVACVMSEHLRIHQIWDEGPPLEVEVQDAIDELIKRREGQVIGLQPSSCSLLEPRKVKLSTGVAAGLLKTKVDPVYPSEARQNHLSGVVVLDAWISSIGSVKALRVISGPAALRQYALEATRQWTYRPYLLNNRPVEFETTINVVFPPAP